MGGDGRRWGKWGKLGEIGGELGIHQKIFFFLTKLPQCCNSTSQPRDLSTLSDHSFFPCPQQGSRLTKKELLIQRRSYFLP